MTAYPVTPLYDADLVMQKDGKTYLCYLNPELQTDRNRQLAVTSQPCWRIVKIEALEIDGYETINRTYPNGDAYHYAYAPELIDTYNFVYRK